MAFVTFDHFAAIKAHLAGFFGRFDTLAIDQGPSWGLSPTPPETIQLTQGWVDGF
jgi:hypothetical protein